MLRFASKPGPPNSTRRLAYLACSAGVPLELLCAENNRVRQHTTWPPRRQATRLPIIDIVRTSPYPPHCENMGNIYRKNIYIYILRDSSHHALKHTLYLYGHAAQTQTKLQYHNSYIHCKILFFRSGIRFPICTDLEARCLILGCFWVTYFGLTPDAVCRWCTRCPWH